MHLIAVDTNLNFIRLRVEKLLEMKSGCGHNGGVGSRLVLASLTQLMHLREIPIMQTTSASLQLGQGQIFSREARGNTLVLNPIIHLGSLHEPEIAHETQELLDFINRSDPIPTNLVIDLALGEYLGTAMLGAVVKLWKRVSQRGGRLALCNVSDNVTEVLRVTKLHAIWPIYGTRDQAVAAIGG